MDIGIIAARYAKALLRYATENGEEDRVCREMNALSQACTALPRLQAAMLNPVLPAESKTKLLATACSPEEKVSGSAARFIDLVVSNKRADLMLFIATAYDALYRRTKRITRGRLTVAAPVGKDTIARMQQLVESKAGGTVEFEVKTEPAIGGGFILDYDTYRLDASLRTRLKRLSDALKN